MKNIGKILRTLTPAAVIIFLMAACRNDPVYVPIVYIPVVEVPVIDPDGPTHYEGTLEIDGQQVWVQNKEAKRQSDEWYFKFEGDSSIDIVTGFSYDDQGNVINLQKAAGSGKIEKGILSFEVPELTSEYLVNADVLNSFFKEYNDVTFDPPDVNGTNILPVTSKNEKLNREGLFLLNSSVGLESVMFIYVDKDCRVTGSPGVITWDLESQSYYSNTDSPLDISFKKGWNTLYRMEVFDRSSGYDNVSLGISNPNDFKWVLYPQE